jgi:hypothetical protein
MTTVAAPPTVRHIARCYGLSSVYVHRLSRVAELTREHWMEPDMIFRKLLDRSHSPLRRKLSDPATRATIHAKLRRS